MANIKVDYRSMDNAISSVDSYIRTAEAKMTAAQREVSYLASNWRGSDASKYMEQWNTVTSEGSAYRKMINALKSYSSFLKCAESEYKNAQARAINRANALPRY